MIKAIIFILSLIGSSFSAKGALDPAPIISQPVSKIMEQFGENQDLVYMAIGMNRCGALLSLVQAVMKRDTGEEILVGVPERMMIMALNAAISKQTERLGQLSKEKKMEVEEGSGNDFDAYLEAYSTRMEANRLSTGDFWGSDEALKADLQFCRSLGEVLPKAEVSYPNIPFERSLSELVGYQKTGSSEDSRNMALEEIGLRCSGLLMLLQRQQTLDGIDADGEERAIAELMYDLALSMSWTRMYPTKQVDEVEIERHADKFVTAKASEKGETYAQWINANSVTAQNLADEDHPFAQEYGSCIDFGRNLTKAYRAEDIN